MLFYITSFQNATGRVAKNPPPILSNSNSSLLLLRLLPFPVITEKLVHRLEIPVNIGSNHNDIDAHIQPEHNDDNSCQISVCTEIINPFHINGKRPGKYVPHNC